MSAKTPKPPRHVWADYDPGFPPGDRWAFYKSKADQRSNRPELKPIKLVVVLAIGDVGGAS